MMTTAIIVDDESKGRDLLRLMLNSHCPNIKIIAEAGSSSEAIPKIEENRPDILFLDVEMKGGSGFDLLEKLGEIDFAVIFVTAYDKYAIKAFKFSAVDYILKPVDEEELVAAVKKAEMAGKAASSQGIKNLIENKVHKTRSNKIALSNQGGLEFIEVNDIVRCQADAKYTICYLSNGRKLLVSKNLKEFEDLLVDYNFYRIHHSHLVNIDYIQKYQQGRGGYVILKDGSTLTVSQRKKEEFLSNLNKI